MKKQLLSLSISALFLVSCGGGSSSKTSKGTDSTKKVAKSTAAVTDSTKKTEVASDNSWKYRVDEDKMNSTKTYFAEVEAKEELQFESPYDGGSTATFVVRNKQSENNVELLISKGQFMVYSGQQVKLRFDDDKPILVNCSEPSDGSSNLIFIGSEAKIIKRLLTAKKLLIQAEFFQSGAQLMEFNVAGFKWDHKSA